MDIQTVIKQSKFDSAYHKAFVNLIYTFNYLTGKQNLIFKKYNVLAQHFNVLKILKGKYPNPVTPKYILEVMLDKGRDLTRLVDKLEESGFVNREVSDENKRSINIYLTPEGLEFTLTLEKEIFVWVKSIANLTEEEAETLSQLLDKMRND